MEFTINSGEKFGAIALTYVPIADDVSEFIPFGHDRFGSECWILRKPPVVLQPYWRGWIGSVFADEVGRANMWIIAKKPSTQPSILDNENKELINTANLILCALLLEAPVDYEMGFLMSGANVDGSPEVREFGRLDPPYRVTSETKHPIPMRQISHAQDIAHGLDAIFQDRDFMRVRRGIRVFLEGLRESYLENRLHQFVRSLEGVIKPAIGKSRKQFAYRAQTFLGHGKRQRQILDESYQIRSQVEHLHDWSAAGFSKCILRNHTCVMEALCRHVYSRLCVSSEIRDLFRDGTIDAFWAKGDDERMKLFGESLNIEDIPCLGFTSRG